MAKEDLIEMEGEVIDTMPNTTSVSYTHLTLPTNKAV